ncbi:YfbK domain-containing protein [Ilumatobacter sp.]|uniref:vWA domain-containing protein n=1 Tax=Ilumatobacter sp. TaxID=1967498 RepID=UPI003C457B3E
MAAGTIVAACSSDDSATDESRPADAEGEFTGDTASTQAPTEAIEVPAATEEEPAEDEAAEDASAADAMEEGDGGADIDAEADPGEDRTASIDVEAPFDESDPGEGDGLFDDEPSDDVEDRFDDNRFEDYGYREFVAAADDPLSTFALDVDTGSYSIARRYLDEDALPPRESVRPEEYVNAFDYDYDAPRDGLDISVDGGPSPFDDDNILVRVGVQGEEVADEDRGPAALTFVIDTSGSMDRDDRLGLVKESLEVLVDELNDDDTVAIVTYSDTSGIVLEPTPVRDRDRIVDAIDELGPGGSTNLESGLREGYQLAREAFDDDGINRVVLASDGVANAGVTDPQELASMIRDDADAGIDLVTVGFGMGNFNDVTMEQLADNGDGFYAYVDTIDEAERLFEDELTSTLLTVAKDAKIQVEFDDQFVQAYRLIGFENRGVRDSDFRDDSVDAGELGAGHQVTAIYEVDLVDDLGLDDRAELGVVALRWEDPDTGEVTETDEDIDLRDVEPGWRDTSDDFQLATVVAAFAEKMRDNPFADAVDIEALAEEADRLADVIDDDDVDELAALIAAAADHS